MLFSAFLHRYNVVSWNGCIVKPQLSVCVYFRQFVGPTDNIYSCSFIQMLEQRLENAFDEAQDKVLETYNRLTVQSVSQEPGSPSVTLVYVVKNQDAILNGTISSGLLNQLTAELVGYFLFYPPLVIAERKYNQNVPVLTFFFFFFLHFLKVFFYNV
uniref:KIAA1549-like b n=1 Tax=Amphiprion percula TaxID=161767 RepID=A0A3P8SE96_AMPPE